MQSWRIIGTRFSKYTHFVSKQQLYIFWDRNISNWSVIHKCIPIRYVIWENYLWSPQFPPLSMPTFLLPIAFQWNFKITTIAKNTKVRVFRRCYIFATKLLQVFVCSRNFLLFFVSLRWHLLCTWKLCTH